MSDITEKYTELREELNNNAGKMTPEAFKKKGKRVDDLERCLILFNQSHFKMLFYKQEMVLWKKKCLDKELEYVNFVTKGLDNECNRTASL